MKCLAFVSAFFCAAWAQTPAPLSFEVASIKPAAPCCSAGESRGASTGFDRIDFKYTTLRYCIGFAYRVKDYQISAPGWMGDQRYDITAKGPAGTRPNQLAEMLQALLAERFKLQVHRETKELSGYELVVAKDGLKIEESAPAAPGPGRTGIRTTVRPGMGGTLTGRGVTMAALATNLSNLLGSPVVDGTNRAGEFPISLEYSRDDARGGTMVRMEGPPPAETGDPGVSIFKSIQKLGLKLESKKVPVEIIVVDHAEKMPTTN